MQDADDVLYRLGPYFPPEYSGPPPPPPSSAGPAVWLLAIALAVVLALIARDIAARRRRPGIRVVDELEISWLPADAVSTMTGDEEVLVVGRSRRRPARSWQDAA